MGFWFEYIPIGNPGYIDQKSKYSSAEFLRNISREIPRKSFSRLF
jgi:hypothetical protein